jgi:hypothetical protein
LKTIDGDYDGGYYDWKRVKRAAVLRRESEEDASCMRGARCLEAKDHGRMGVARQRPSDTTWVDVR